MCLLKIRNTTLPHLTGGYHLTSHTGIHEAGHMVKLSRARKFYSGVANVEFTNAAIRIASIMVPNESVFKFTVRGHVNPVFETPNAEKLPLRTPHTARGHSQSWLRLHHHTLSVNLRKGPFFVTFLLEGCPMERDDDFELACRLVQRGSRHNCSSP